MDKIMDKIKENYNFYINFIRKYKKCSQEDAIEFISELILTISDKEKLQDKIITSLIEDYFEMFLINVIKMELKYNSHTSLKYNDKLKYDDIYEMIEKGDNEDDNYILSSSTTQDELIYEEARYYLDDLVNDSSNKELETYEKIVYNMLLDGKNKNEISKELNIPYTTIYFMFKDLDKKIINKILENIHI